MRRAGIYLTYDKQNIVDEYIGYMLKELKTCVDYLVVICNELHIEEGLDFLEMYADEIFYRENIGFDAGGFKDALCKFIGWEKILDYEELILVNDSFFGPFCPMIEIFEEMSKKNCDFWGLSKHSEWEEEGEFFPEHLQSFFIAIRGNMLHDINFRKYWEDMPYYKTLQEVVFKHEVIFTPYFLSCGFTFDCLADMQPNDSKVKANNYIQYSKLSYELMKKRNFPFLKKQQLVYDTMYCQTQENLKQSLEYIDRETQYDINLIWNNILRIFDISDLQRSLHLQYIIPQSQTVEKSICDILIVVFVEYMESKEIVLEYLESLKEIYKIKIVASTIKILHSYKNSGFDTYLLQNFIHEKKYLERLGDIELVCVLHDADITGDRNPSCVGKSYFFNIWENVLKNHMHIQGIIELFDREHRLGLLAPPRANFAKFFSQTGGAWGDNFERIKIIKEELKLKCPINKEKRPLMDTDNFWIRGRILKQVAEMIMDAGEITRFSQAWCYIAQDKGYYSGIVESGDYSAINEINLQHYLNILADQVRRQYGNYSDFSEFHKHIFRGAAAVFCNKMEKVYIYGTGIRAKEYEKLIPCFSGYIVSDGQKKERMINHKKVMYLSEINAEDNIGIIVCLGKRNQEQVISLLREKGWKNYLCI